MPFLTQGKPTWKFAKIIGKIILIIVILIILLVINALLLSRIPIGITLPMGWEGGCYDYKYTGFPFSVISLPPPGTLCVSSVNITAFILNFIFLVILTGIIFRRIIKKQDWKLIFIVVVVGGILGYFFLRWLGFDLP